MEQVLKKKRKKTHSARKVSKQSYIYGKASERGTTEVNEASAQKSGSKPAGEKQKEWKKPLAILREELWEQKTSGISNFLLFPPSPSFNKLR